MHVDLKTMSNAIVATASFFAAYLVLAIVTDLRIDKLRPFIMGAAIKQGVLEGIKAYKEEKIKSEQSAAHPVPNRVTQDKP